MIELHINKQLFVPKFLPLLLDYSHRWEFYMGSAGSGKSYFISEKILIRCLNQQIRVLVCRRYGTTIRNTVFAQFKEVLKKFKILEYCKINESDFRISFPNGSEIIFIGLDDETKLLSLTNISCIFVEEAYEVPKEIIEQLNLRLRGAIENQQIILAWNPISKHSYLYDLSVVHPPKNSVFIHSTYKDNPFLTKEYIETLEELYERNPAKARIYCDGEWGISTEGLVFTNWEIQNIDPSSLSSLGLEHRAGCDIGWIDPTAIVDTLYDKKNGIIYIFNEYYASGKQLDQIRDDIEDMNLKKVKIYFDSAEPRVIDYFKKNNYQAYPCIKGAGSVKARITFLQNNKLVVAPNCAKVIRDLENFSYLKDKRTGEYIEDQFEDHAFSHTIDALGYAYSDIYSKSGFKTLDKSVLGL